MNGNALNAVITLRKTGKQLCITPQNLIEFWAAATCPLGVNGLGMAVDEASREFAQMKGFFMLQPNIPEVLVVCEQLVADLGRLRIADIFNSERLVIEVLQDGVS